MRAASIDEASALVTEILAPLSILTGFFDESLDLATSRGQRPTHLTMEMTGVEGIVDGNDD